MKHRYTALTGIVLGAALLLSAIGCTGAPAGSGNATSAQETQPAAPEPDTRQLTDTTAYKARLSNSFEGIEPATAAELTFTADAGGVTITGYTGGATVLVIPAELDGKPVVAVGEGAFRGAAVRALSLPDSLRRIGFGALEKCRELVTLRTPLLCADGKDWFASLFGADSYMSGATAVPAKLTTLILTGGADLRTVPDYCFYGCTGLETVGLPAGVETVGAFAFYGAGSLAYVSLPDSLRRRSDDCVPSGPAGFGGGGGLSGSGRNLDRLPTARPCCHCACPPEPNRWAPTCWKDAHGWKNWRCPSWAGRRMRRRPHTSVTCSVLHRIH